MADPLIEAAQTLAPVPAKTNFFDPIPGESITARYAGSRRVLKDMGETAEDEMRLRAPIEADRRIARDLVLEDREDQDYFDKQEARNSRGAFLDSISKLDPEADDYDAAVSEVVGGMPPGVMEDDAVRAIIAYKNGVAAKAQAGRQKLQEIEARNAGVMQRIMANQTYKAAWEGMTPEDRAKHQNADGTMDVEGLLMDVGARSTKYKEGEFDRREGVKQSGRVQLLDRRTQAAAEKKIADEVLADTEAFPSAVEQLRKAHLTKSGKPLDDKYLAVKDLEGFTAAKAKDKNRDAVEANAARDMDENAYVNAAGSGISAKAKEKRRALWKSANAGAPVAAQPTVAPAAAPAADQDIRAQKKAQAAYFLDQAKGDRALAEKLFREAQAK